MGAVSLLRPALRAVFLAALGFSSRADAIRLARMAPRAAPLAAEASAEATVARSRRLHIFHSIAPVVGASSVVELARAASEGDVRPTRHRDLLDVGSAPPQYEIVRDGDGPEYGDGPCSPIEFKLISDGFA